MSFSKGFAVAAMLLMGASAAMAEEYKIGEYKSQIYETIDLKKTLGPILGYACTVKGYDDKSSDTTDLIEPFYVMINNERDPVPAEAIQVDSVSYNITRFNGSIVVEANGEGNPGPEFIVPDGTPVGIKMKKEKQILTCTPPKINEATMQPFGDLSQKRLAVDPQAYGESMQMLRSFKFISPEVRARIEALKESLLENKQ